VSKARLKAGKGLATGRCPGFWKKFKPERNIALLIHRIRTRLRDILRAEVAQTVSNPAELEDELRHLLHMARRI
jgi:hypothetical protein